MTRDVDVAAIAPGDLVLVSAGGRVFHARVLGRERAGRLAVAPLEARVRDRGALVHDVVEHWAHVGGRPRPAPGQPRLEELAP